ncbi:MAG: hypothetical protein JW809_06415 [Pirellulales bacterium]|nr:hypothetical protein [Pirellulales bacterium]
MTGRRLFAVVAVLVALAGAWSLAGCSRESQGKNVTRDPAQVATLAKLYGDYRKAHGGKAPPDEAAFKAFVKEAVAKGTASPPGAKPVSDPEALFVSEGDGQPLVILYGPGALDGPKEGPGGMPVVMYEQEGVGGKRFVASPMGLVNEVNQERFEQLVPKGGSSK